jgi:hypothetical protein
MIFAIIKISEREMRWLNTVGVGVGPTLFGACFLRRAAKAAGMFVFSFLLVFLFMAAVVERGFAQCPGCADNGTSILGVHSNGGRECASCHAPHTGSSGTEPGIISDQRGPEQDGSEQVVADNGGSRALWGHNANPSYGMKVLFGDTENSVEVVAAGVASPSEEVEGILLCLSCHDGNVSPQTMMARQSYERKMGILGHFGKQPIPTLLGDDAIDTDNSVDHPLGADATIPLTSGLHFANGMFSVMPGSPYARFMTNYGLPVLTPGKRSVPYGVNSEGKPYLLCTTCHNQHLGAVYPSTRTSPIGGDGGGRTYRTYFFANGPYNAKFDDAPGDRAASTAQFCRQCHIDLANEGNNTLNIKTAFY